MNLATVIAVIALILVVFLALRYIYKEKKKGSKCIGCPYESVCTTCLVKKAEIAGPGKQPLALCERPMYMVQNGAFSIPECP